MSKKTMAKAVKLPSGNWNVKVFVGYDDNGKKIRKSFTAATRWEVERQAAEYLESRNDKKPTITVGEAIDSYIASKENVLAPSTIRGYKTVRRNRLPSIMLLDITEVNSINMQFAINEDARKVEWKSINEAKNLIVAACRMYGVKLDLSVTLPAKKRKIKKLPTAEQVIKAIKGSDVELPCMLSIWLSLRVSEVRGLQFRDIENNVVTVCRSRICLNSKDTIRENNKTFYSTRQLTIPSYIQGLIDKVKHDKDTDFIVDMDYQTLCRHFKKQLALYGLSMNFHDLRHLNASVMLMLGVPDKYAMERGGWSTNHTLKSVYQHTFSDERKAVDTKIDNYFNNLLGL